jgi:FMN phosphatase YigB (HAD superfamily)
MTLTVLFDLDDTLLDNDIDAFLPVYLQALGKHMAGYVAPDQMLPKLMAATRVMLSNNSALLSLERAFDQAFYPAIGYSKARLRAPLEHFYDTVFPGLQYMTRRRPDASQVVRYARERGHLLVVATNPLFPYKAIYHRLRWAGLDPAEIPFALITTYERFHYAKPNPAYVAEILAQLGWPDQPAVIIGNSLENDLAPAAGLGLPVFWVTGQALPAGYHPLSASGRLADVPAWLEAVEAADPAQEFLTPGALLAVLKSTPAMLDTLCAGLDERQWRARPAPEEWSLTEIACHLRDVDGEVNTARFDKVIDGGNPFLPGIDTDTWAQERDYRQQDGPAALRQFIEVRTRLVARLEALAGRDWQQPARHAIFGPTNLQELVGFVATHDRSHVQQSLATARSLGGKKN